VTKKSMKNLFFPSLRSKQAVYSIIVVVLFVAVTSFLVFEGTKKTVAMTLNGEQTEIRTHASTVGELLKHHNITVSENDLLTPSVNTKIENDLTIEWEKARPVTVTVDQETKTVMTTDINVKDILAQADVAVTEHDKVTPALDGKIGKDDQIKIEKAFEVTLVDGMDKKKVMSTSTTVADFLKQQEVKLNEFDRVEQRMEEVVLPNDVVKVVRVEKVTDVVEEATKFAVETKKDSSLLKGTEKIVQKGENGTVSRTYEIIKENGKPVSRILKGEKVVKDPKKKVVAVGTKVVMASAAPTKAKTKSISRGDAPSSSKEFYVSATAYTAFCNGCSGVTSTGINLKANPDAKVIAVDPSVIPLGTKVWVEGYGYAVAGDTGSAIKGNKIDVFMPTKQQAYGFGRKKVKVKILD
jgi:uncharacterized protein YabE (DUF348 family)